VSLSKAQWGLCVFLPGWARRNTAIVKPNLKFFLMCEMRSKTQAEGLPGWDQNYPNLEILRMRELCFSETGRQKVYPGRKVVRQSRRTFAPKSRERTELGHQDFAISAVR